MKKERFTTEFVRNFFSEKNTIIRKSDGYRWWADMANWNLHDKSGWKSLFKDETLEPFFDDNNEFRSDEYDLVYIDYFAEWRKEELRKHGAEWINNLPQDGTSEKWLKKIIG